MSSTLLYKNNTQRVFWTFAKGSEPTHATNVALTVTRANGEVLTAPLVNPEPEPGLFSALLSIEHVGELDDLTLHWTGSVEEEDQSHVCVVPLSLIHI